MTTPVFTPPTSPSAGATDRPELKILQAEFGDGYNQPTPDGVNHIRTTLALKFELLEAEERSEIVDFLTARKGVEPFLYQLPGSPSARLYTCAEWETTALAASLFTVSATLRQSFQVTA